MSSIEGLARWRWNRVLPIVYDDSLSQYEILCKLVREFNKTIENTTNVIDSTEQLKNLVEHLLQNGDSGIPVIEELGICSDFRFALRPPASFDKAAFLAAAEADLVDFASNGWTYQNSASTTIPLLTNSPNYSVENAAGAVTSCSPFVCDCLYKAGYTDLEGLSYYMTQPERYLRTYLINKGWSIVNSIDELAAGDVVATSWRRDSDNLFLPGHTFIYAGNGYKYDAGSDSMLAAGTPSPVNWNTGYDQLYRTLVSGLYHVRGTINMGYSDDESELMDWFGLVMSVQGYVENIERNGYHVIQIWWNGRRTVIRQTSDNAINWDVYADNRMQQAGYAVFNPSNANSLVVETQNTLAFGNIANNNPTLYTLNNDGSVTVNITGVYDVSFVIQHIIDASDAQISADSLALITANIFSYDSTDSNEYAQLSITQPYSSKRNTISGHRIIRLSKGQRIRLKVFLGNTVNSNLPTLFTGLSQTQLSLYLVG